MVCVISIIGSRLPEYDKKKSSFYVYEMKKSRFYAFSDSLGEFDGEVSLKVNVSVKPVVMRD